MLLKRLNALRYIFNSNIKLHPKAKVDFGAHLDAKGGPITIGAKTKIHPYAVLKTYYGSITVGETCSINPFCVLYGHGGLTIGNNVLIGAQTVIVPSNHVFEDVSKPINQQGDIAKGITIKDDVWIGAGARILDGVTIETGCVIAAGSVLTRSTQPYEVWAGVPAKKVRNRGEK